MVISFDALPACDGRTDRQADTLPMSKSHTMCNRCVTKITGKIIADGLGVVLSVAVCRNGYIVLWCLFHLLLLPFWRIKMYIVIPQRY